MLTLVFVFMLFNLTSIWNLPTISTGVMGMMASRALFALVPSSLSVVTLEKRPHEASSDGGNHPRFCAMLRHLVR